MKRPAAAAALETVPAKRPAAKVPAGRSRQITRSLMQLLPQSQLDPHPNFLPFLAQEPLRRTSALHIGMGGSKNGACA